MALAIYAPAHCSWSARGGGRGHSQLAAGSSSDPDPPGNGGCTVPVLFGMGSRTDTRQHFRARIYDCFFQLQVCAFPAKHLIDVVSRKL